MSDGQSEKQVPTVRIPAIAKRAERLLMKDEEILAAAEQTDFTRWWVWPSNGVVVTSKRILFLYQGFFSFRFFDFHWEHVEDIHLSQAMISASISITAAATKSGLATKTASQKTQRWRLSGLKKSQAEQVYSTGQQMEHEWRERNRQRVMEETRASKGGYVVQQQAAAPAPSQEQPDPAARLKKLKSLLDAEVISQEEFDKKKSEILSDL